MPDNMAALTSPDLSSLAEDTRLRLRVAVAAGATWERLTHRDGGWMLHGNRAFRGKVLLLPHGQMAVGWNHLVPDWPAFPAAWGALMEAERISLQPTPNATGEPVQWQANFTWDDKSAVYADSPGRAVCLAVLAKHGLTL